MANTFELIASSTVGSGGASSIDFTSIPSTYTDLVVKFSVRNSAGATWGTLTLNGSSSNWSLKNLYGDGSSAGSQSQTVNTFTVMQNNTGDTASTFTNSEFYIPNYAGSNYKSISYEQTRENNATAAYIYMHALLWSNTAAINQITLNAITNNFAQYSTAYLYGVKSS
jgi:hypothetical protein